MSLRCTAVKLGGARCLSEKIVRDFCSSWYPDGPAIRLCQRHADAFHLTAVNAVRLGDGSLPMESLEMLCDEWRFLAPDCL